MNTAVYLTFSSPKLCTYFITHYCLEDDIFSKLLSLLRRTIFAFLCSAEILENVICLK